jgi:hypothetical protein
MAKKRVTKKVDPDIAEGKRLRQLMCDIADDYDNEFILADSFDAAIVGYATMCTGSATKVVYDHDKCIDILRKDMSEEEAIEYMSYNVTGAYIGENTPLFIRML